MGWGENVDEEGGGMGKKHGRGGVISEAKGGVPGGEKGAGGGGGRLGGMGRRGEEVVTPSRDMMELLLRAAPSLLDQFVVYVAWLQLLVSQVT